MQRTSVTAFFEACGARKVYGLQAKTESERGWKMDIPIDVEVFCTDGYCGRSTGAVLKPNTEEVTHLVVKEKESPHEEILIPVTAVTASTPDSINLSYTRKKLAQLQPFVETDFVKIEIPRYAGGLYSMAGEFYPESEVWGVKHKVIPEGELALLRGARVEATDGRVGRVDELLIDPEDNRITHLVLREGHLWGQKEVTIPVSEIERIAEDTVHLKIDKRTIESLPTVPVQ
jgi:sporulation protein YlmC with PRC-barrel domain